MDGKIILFTQAASAAGLLYNKALYGYSCSRLAARMYDLKRLGHQIEKRMVEVPTRDGRRARVAEYTMAREGASA